MELRDVPLFLRPFPWDEEQMYWSGVPGQLMKINSQCVVV